MPDSLDTVSMLHSEPLQSSRPPPSLVEAMKFWNAIFPEAMSEFKKSSAKTKRPSTSPYNIRDAQKWEEIEVRLTAARAAYEGSKGSITSYVRRGIRKVGENSQPAKMVLGIVKDVQYLSPVACAVQMVLDVSCTGLQSVIKLTGTLV